MYGRVRQQNRESVRPHLPRIVPAGQGTIRLTRPKSPGARARGPSPLAIQGSRGRRSFDRRSAVSASTRFALMISLVRRHRRESRSEGQTHRQELSFIAEPREASDEAERCSAVHSFSQLSPYSSRHLCVVFDLNVLGSAFMSRNQTRNWIIDLEPMLIRRGPPDSDDRILQCEVLQPVIRGWQSEALRSSVRASVDLGADPDLLLDAPRRTRLGRLFELVLSDSRVTLRSRTD